MTLVAISALRPEHLDHPVTVAGVVSTIGDGLFSLQEVAADGPRSRTVMVDFAMNPEDEGRYCRVDGTLVRDKHYRGDRNLCARVTVKADSVVFVDREDALIQG